VYRRDLLRRSYRDERGRPQKETLANLSALPEVAIEALRKVLSGTVVVEPDQAFEIERSLSHGGVAAVHEVANQLGIQKLLGPDCRERDLAYGLILARVLRPTSTLSTLGWWNDTTLGTDLGIAQASTDEVYAAMDWLGARQDTIEKALAGRHLTTGGIAMFDLSGSWVEGHCCEPAAFGYSRDNKRGVRRIEYGLLTDPQGRPVAIRVFPSNTSDTKSFIDAVTVVGENFGLTELTMVGDRGMITNARIAELRTRGGLDWITALLAPAITALASDDGPLQRSLFDQRAHKRQQLLAATDSELTTITARVANGTLRGAEDIGLAVGKIVNKYTMATHFTLDITENTFNYHHDQQQIDAQAALDGIYVIRTSLPAESLDTPGVITSYKNLAYVERDFRIIKVDDLDLRPIFHYLFERVRSHVLLCMLAAYITWHLRQTLAPLTYTDEHIPHRTDPVAPVQLSASATTKDASKKTPDGLPTQSFRDLLEHLSKLDRETINFTGQRIDKITNPTPTQRRAFELINVPIPLTLTDK
jgi:hypothetical protein